MQPDAVREEECMHIQWMAVAAALRNVVVVDS